MKKGQVQDSMTPFLEFAIYVVGYNAELIRLGMDSESAFRLTMAFQHDLIMSSMQRRPLPGQDGEES